MSIFYGVTKCGKQTFSKPKQEINSMCLAACRTCVSVAEYPSVSFGHFCGYLIHQSLRYPGLQLHAYKWEGLHKFWPHYDPHEVDRDLGYAEGIRLNQFRTFVPYQTPDVDPMI